MMNALNKKLIAVAAAITMWAVIQPGAVSAQTSGVGGDSLTRILWRGTDGRIALWKLDGGFNCCVASAGYGPFDEWLPIAITTTNDNNTVVLWRRTDGLVSLWLVDTNFNFVTSATYGPFLGWVAESLSPDTNGNSFIRLIWRETRGIVGVWGLDPNLNLVISNAFGPFFGFDPGNATPAVKSPSSPANAKAAAAMVTNAVSPKPFPAQAK